MTNLEQPKINRNDIAYTVIKSVLSSVPIVGGSSAEIFAAIIVPPIEKRKEQWINNIVKKLQEIEEKLENFKVENLAQNEIFITTLLQATSIAIRNHHREKLECLKNAVLNSALPETIETDLQLMFLKLVDELTVSHISLLAFLNNPPKWCHNHKINQDISRGDFINHVLPNYKSTESETFYQRIVIDLQEKGLLNSLNSPQLESIAKFRRQRDGYPLQPEKVLNKEEIDREKYWDLIASIKSIKLGLDAKWETRNTTSGGYTTKLGESFLGFLSSPIEQL